MKDYVLALDQGTTSSRAIVFNREGDVCALAQKEFEQSYPQPGWVEHDANEIWYSQASVAAEAISRLGINGEQIAAIGITNQRETTILWDRKTGEPVYNAIVWQDKRTASHCEEYKEKGYGEMVKQKTGLLLDPYFSASKIRWILDNVPGARKKAEAGKLAFGTVDTWLAWKFTNGKLHVTDVTNASRTLLFNIHTLEWDQELLEAFNVPVSLLPEVKQTSEIIGETATTFFAAKIPIGAMVGDQQAALFGQLCTEPGMVKTTYGTGGFLMMNTGDTVIQSQNNLLSTLAWKINGQVNYALEGSVFVAGAVFQWMRDGLGILDNISDVESLAATVEDNGGVYFVPAFTGLGAPHWNSYARGTITGITRGTTAAHIARAAIESIAFQVNDVVKAMQQDLGQATKQFHPSELRVDGRPTKNKMLMQFQADILEGNVSKPIVYEVTALGAAYLAGLAVGYWENIGDVKGNRVVDHCYVPKMNPKQVKYLVAQWNKVISISDKILK